MSPLNLLRRILPKRWIRFYHRTIAITAAWWYGRPSRHLAVIGVTGTDGKTTTVAMLAAILEAAGKSVGVASSVFFQVGKRRWTNETHMTMLGRFALQRLMRDMVKSGCQYLVLEVSSEGLLQHRHRGIDVDGAIFTNLSPEHLETHGTFEDYRNAKGRLFSQIIRGGDKQLGHQAVPKFSLVNLDDQEADYFSNFWAEQRHGITFNNAKPSHEVLRVWKVTNAQTEKHSGKFSLEGQPITLGMPGKYNLYNAGEAAVAARILGIDWEPILSALKNFSGLAGRYEVINTPNDVQVIVDYALTPVALKSFFEAVQQSGIQHIIAVFGAAGGGRDRWKRPELGKIAAIYATHVILTADDPYNDDPRVIAEEILAGVPAEKHQIVEIIPDRRQAIQRGLALARAGDAVTVTGMGAETSIMVGGKRIPWNDAEQIRSILKS